MTQRIRLSLDAWRRLKSSINGPNLPKWRVDFAYSLHGLLHSSLFRLQNASYADGVRSATPSPPLFLLGFWRSGTTLLHEFFSCDSNFGFPSTYACLNPSHFLLTEQWASARHSAATKRPMDNMSYSWASPQEDEFALLALGAPSPYEALIAPSLMRQPRYLLDLDSRTLEERTSWVAALQSFLSLLTVQQHKPMVLKSPPHGFKLPLLLELYPQARFLLIERNPYEVFASNVKLWRTLLDLYAVEPWSVEDVESFVLEAYVIHEEAISRGARLAGSSQFSRVRYEDLVHEPAGEIKRLYDELNLPWSETLQAAMEEHIRGMAGHARNRFLLSLEQRERIERHWRVHIKEKGYEFSDEYIQMKN
jgi:omega-hydroxy-beta-dihydromenaquinone-9 sulfotransferase